MQNASLDESQAVIKIAGKNINNLRYADDITLMAESNIVTLVSVWKCWPLKPVAKGFPEGTVHSCYLFFKWLVFLLSWSLLWYEYRFSSFHLISIAQYVFFIILIYLS